MTRPPLLQAASERRGPRARSRGVAIVSVLLIVMLISLIVGGLFWREHVAVRSIQNRSALAQLRWIETAVLDWAAVVLRADQNAASEVDHLLETWATPVAETRLDETVTAGASIGEASQSALIAGQIEDAQARIDLNSLVRAGEVDAARVAIVQRLLSLMGLQADLLQNLLEVLQAPAGSVLPLLRLSDLNRLPGFDPAVLAVLEPFVILLPVNPPGMPPNAGSATRININTAPAEVIAAAIPGLSLDEARRFVLVRERNFFTSLELAQSRFDRPVQLDPERFAVKSSYFLLRGMVRFGRVEAETEALFFRAPARVELIWRQRL